MTGDGSGGKMIRGRRGRNWIGNIKGLYIGLGINWVGKIKGVYGRALGVPETITQ